MKKALLGIVVVLGAVAASHAAARRMGREMRDSCTEMLAKCRPGSV
jgi:hypothetical protein